MSGKGGDNIIAKHKVGNVSYVRYVHKGETYVSVEGYGLEDKDKTWKVKVDKKTGKRFYVSLGRHGRGWLLPGEEPEQHKDPQAELNASMASAASTASSQGAAQVVQSTGHEAVQLMDLYKQRLPFNPTDCPLESPKELVTLILHEILAATHELQLTAEGIMSVVLSTVHYLNTNYAQQNISKDEISNIVLKLCYIIASECKANVLSSPFLECQTKVMYLSSINDSIESTVADQSNEVEVIQRNIALREQERKKAAAKLETWIEKCDEADREISEATSETHNITHSVEGYLQSTADVAKVITNVFPSEGKACLAQIERLRAQLQESSNSSRVLQDTYHKIQGERRSVQATLSADRVLKDDAATKELASLREAHNTLLSENTDLKIRLKSAELRSRETPHEADLRQKLTEAKQEIAELKRAHQEMEAAHQKERRAGYGNKGNEQSKAEDILRRMGGEGDVVVTGHDRRVLLQCIQQQKQLLETLVESREQADEEVVDTEMFNKCLTAAQLKIRQQRQQIKELKSLLNLCLDVRDSPDDPIRAFINTAISSPTPSDTRETLTPVMLDISPRH
eukprot:TRINITY_DN1395_c0_g1_i1.p1 TRINITY_DN1395_c0_g1~~TRINITY_DN1395_c0_g1_i1.p1  ORF type:complete len:578 (+),score=219.65 TRINITY_DN1395_c0_g1_i1:27-1736(+)